VPGHIQAHQGVWDDLAFKDGNSCGHVIPYLHYLQVRSTISNQLCGCSQGITTDLVPSLYMRLARLTTPVTAPVPKSARDEVLATNKAGIWKRLKRTLAKRVRLATGLRGGSVSRMGCSWICPGGGLVSGFRNADCFFILAATTARGEVQSEPVRV